MNRRFGKAWIGAALAVLLTAGVARRPSQADEPVEVRYLAFQVFTGAPDPTVAIGGTVGEGQSQLALIFGPLAFDHSDDEIGRFIATAFSIARERKIAVGFHIDDSMFWARRGDLWRTPDNVEWLDWNGTPNTGRRIDWGPQPQKLPPQMCFNSKAIQWEVRRRAADVFGKAIKSGIDRLKQQGKERLFAGAIAGWETHIGQDFDTGRSLGYRALTNRGFSKTDPPHDMDGELEKTVQEFITLWTQGLADAGIPANKIYAHTAFLSNRIFEANPPQTLSYSQANHFAPPSVAFGKSHRPGFSTYPQPGLFEQIYEELPGEDVQSRGDPGEHLFVGHRRRGKQEHGLSRSDGGRRSPAGLSEVSARPAACRGRLSDLFLSGAAPCKDPPHSTGIACLGSEDR